MSDINLLLARAQIDIMKITLGGFLFMLCALLAILIVPNLRASTSPEVVALVSSAVGVLGTILTQQNGFFYARPRHQEPNDLGSDNPDPTAPVQPAKP